MKAVVTFGSLVTFLLISGCAVVRDIHLESVPPGAAVYLVPKIKLERDPEILNDEGKLAKYRVPEGNTPVVTRAREKVYIAIFLLDGKLERRELDVLPPPHNNNAMAVFQ